MSTPLLSVDALTVVYRTPDALRTAVENVSLEVNAGEILGIVGESGCGKSTLSSALLGLLPPNGRVTDGAVLFKGRNLLELDREQLRQLRGAELAMIFQDPLSSLNPTFKVGKQMIDAQRAHRKGRRTRKHELRRRAIEVLARVGIPDAEDRIGHFPHQFSGGMRQRIMIATALLFRPALLIADEPTSALDVTLEAQILELLRQLRDAHGTAILFISHDLGVIAQTCDRVVVMYAGRAVEEGDVASIFEAPRHPYTEALLAATPQRKHRGQRLATIPGRVPSLAALPVGCKFADRCLYCQNVCREREPDYLTVEGRHVRCYIYDAGSDYRQDDARQRESLR